MCSGKSYGCHLYGMKKRKACVLDIDMELPSVMLSNVQWKKFWISSIWHEEEEGMCTGYWYGNAFCDYYNVKPTNCTPGTIYLYRYIYFAVTFVCTLCYTIVLYLLHTVFFNVLKLLHLLCLFDSSKSYVMNTVHGNVSR